MPYPPTGGLSLEQADAVDSIIDLPDNAVPKALGGELVESKANVDPVSEEYVFDKSINVPQASLKISDTLSISEATLVTFIRDNVEETNAVNATAVIRDEGTDPLQFLEAASKQVVIAQPLFNTEFNTNPFTAPLLSTLDNQTDAVTIKVASAMTNVRMTITDNDSGVVIKYIPDKAAVVSGIGGLDLVAGDNRIDFNSNTDDVPASGLFYIGHTPLRQGAGQASTFMITADSVSILGEPGGIPFFRNEIQFLKAAIVPTVDQVTNLADSYTRLNAEYGTTAGTTAGIAVNYEATATADSATLGQFTAGDPGVSNPTLITDGSDTFAQGAIIQISNTRLNNGFFEVEDHTGNVLTPRGIGTVDTVEAFTRRDFVTTVDNAIVTQVNLSIIRAGIDGKWEQGKGSQTPIVYVDLDVFGSEYQYEASESESTTSSTTFQNKLTLTTPVIPSGFYRSVATFEVTNDSGDKPVVTETVLDGNQFSESFYAPKFEDEYLMKTSFAAQALTNAVHVIEINFRSTSEGGTAKIKRARVELFRVS